MKDNLILTAIEHAAFCRRALLADGLETKQVSNTDVAMKRMEAIRDYPVSHPLSARSHDFTEENSFWIFLQNDGADVGGVCAKYTDLGNEKLPVFLSRTFQRQFFPNNSGSVASIDISDFLDIRGRAVYLGDIFISKPWRGSGSRSRDLMHLLFITSLFKWSDLDWIYSFLRDEDIGRAHYYGFGTNVPTPLVWTSPKDGRSNDEYIAALSKQALLHCIPAWSRKRSV